MLQRSLSKNKEQASWVFLGPRWHPGYHLVCLHTAMICHGFSMLWPKKAHFAKAVETVGRFKSHAKTLVDTMLPEDRGHKAERQGPCSMDTAQGLIEAY